MLRADHHVALRHAAEDGRQIARVMAEVGVHVDVKIEVVLHGVTHRRQDGGAEAEFAGAVQDVDARVLGGEVVGDTAGAIRGELSSMTKMSAAGK